MKLSLRKIFLIFCLILPASNRGTSCEDPVSAALFNVYPALEPNWHFHRSQLEKYVDVESQLESIRSWAIYRNIHSKVLLGVFSESLFSSMLTEISNRTSYYLESEIYEIFARLELMRGNPKSAKRSQKAAMRLFSSLHFCSGQAGYTSRLYQLNIVRQGLNEYVHFHKEMLAAGNDLRGRRFLVCQPTFGLGNRINALMMCFAMAVASRRAVLVHWNCVSCKFLLDHPHADPSIISNCPSISFCQLARLVIKMIGRH